MNTYLITFMNGTTELISCDDIIPDRKNDGRFLNVITNGQLIKTYNTANVVSIESMDI